MNSENSESHTLMNFLRYPSLLFIAPDIGRSLHSNTATTENLTLCTLVMFQVIVLCLHNMADQYLYQGSHSVIWANMVPGKSLFYNKSSSKFSAMRPSKKREQSSNSSIYSLYNEIINALWNCSSDSTYHFSGDFLFDCDMLVRGKKQGKEKCDITEGVG